MKSAADVRLARTLLATLDGARDFRENFEDAKYVNFPIVELRDICLTEEPKESRRSQGFEGALEVPKDLAIEWMQWLEARARQELDKIGVRV
jgi:hypothetical protein